MGQVKKKEWKEEFCSISAFYSVKSQIAIVPVLVLSPTHCMLYYK